MNRIAMIGILTVLVAGTVVGRSIEVRDTSELKSALRTVKSGDEIIIESGQYRGGHSLNGISGQPGRPIIITGRDPNNPPVFTEGTQALHLSDCNYIVLKNIKVAGFPSNGINIDDGGTFETPAHHILIENVTILDTGPQGNHDALKMSGVDLFIVRHCHLEGWAGSAIDMVGCHQGVVEDCTFIGKSGHTQSSGIQMKGGTAELLVQCNLFRDTGERAINLGGSTGLPYFRPKVDHYEASKIIVAGNRFVGSVTPVAWVTADGGSFHHNTIVLPDKWVLRILQETKEERFRPCHDGLFEKNLIVFDESVQYFANVGPGTNPQSFTFRDNIWYDTQGQRKPQLPTVEQNPHYQPDLIFESGWRSTGAIKPQDPQLQKIGATGYLKPVNRILD